MAQVAVLGVGVVGMTSVYALARKGLAVTVVDSASAPAQARASFGNGTQLSYSSDALAFPSLVADLPQYIFGLDPGFRLRIGISPEFWTWALSFLANASTGEFERDTTTVLKLAMESRMELAEVSSKVAAGPNRCRSRVGAESGTARIRHPRSAGPDRDPDPKLGDPDRADRALPGARAIRLGCGCGSDRTTDASGHTDGSCGQPRAQPIASEVFLGADGFRDDGRIIVGTVLTLLFLPTLYVAWFPIKGPHDPRPSWWERIGLFTRCRTIDNASFRDPLFRCLASVRI